MRETLIILSLAIVIIGSSITASFAQKSPLVYNVHINFYYVSCSLSNLQVMLNDQSGRMVASTIIPTAFVVTLTYVAVSPTSSLTATALALASIASYKSWTVSGSSTIPVGAGGDYWVTIRMS